MDNIVAVMQPVLMDTGFIKKVFDGVTGTVKTIGAGIVVILGILLIIAGVMQATKAFASGGAARSDWLIIIGCFLVGGILAIGGWKMVATADGTLGSVGKDTADAIGLKGSLSAGGYSDGNIGAGLTIIADDFLLPFGKCFATCTGAILVTMCVYYISMYFLKHQMKISWLRLLVMVILGSCLFANSDGFAWVKDNGTAIFKNMVENFADGDSSGKTDFGITADGLGS